MILDIFITLSLGLTSQYNVDPVVVNNAPDYNGLNFVESNRVYFDQFIIPRRDAAGSGVFGATEILATHHVANYVRLKIGIPLWYEFGTDVTGGDSSSFALGNILLGTSFALPFSSSDGGWDFVMALGVDSRIPTSSDSPVGAAVTPTRYSLFLEETFSLMPYAGIYGERDIVSFQATVGYDLVKTSPTTMKVVRAQAGVSYHQLDPVFLALEYNFSKINDLSGVSGANVTYQELSPSVQYMYKNWRFSGMGMIFFGDLQDNSYGGVALRAAYNY